MSLLFINRLYKFFGGLAAVNGVDIEVERNEVVGLMGPNGSGKTTLFNCVTGSHIPSKGQIFLDGEDITALAPHVVANKGISRIFQITRVFPELTVVENVLIGQRHSDEKITQVLFTKSSSGVYERALELLDLVELTKLKDKLAGELSHGQQRLLTLARVLMQNPKLVLLDEPTAGVNPTLCRSIVSKILDVNRKHKVTFFIIEHNMNVMMELAQRIYVLFNGGVIAEGAPEEIQRNDEVLEVYYGE